jgi:Sec-independent protein translocase protein TatA
VAVGFLGVGPGELALVLVLIVLLFGVERAPAVARALGRWQARFGAIRDDVLDTIDLEGAGITKEQAMHERAREAQMRQQRAAPEELVTEGTREPRAPPGDKPPG